MDEGLFGGLLSFSHRCSRHSPKRGSEAPETEKAPVLLAKRIEAILDQVFQPGDRLLEVDLAEQFEVSRQPVREALLALEKESTVTISPYKGAR
jgi:DNA-binding GntR family transcriptional regulator